MNHIIGKFVLMGSGFALVWVDEYAEDTLGSHVCNGLVSPAKT